MSPNGSIDSGQAPDRSLTVVQLRATQFDGPFFRYLARAAAFRLQVYYTDTEASVTPYDSELASHPGWDNDTISGYSFRIFPQKRLQRIRQAFAIVAARPGLIILSGVRSADNMLIFLLALVLRVPLGFRSDNCFMAPKPSSFPSTLRSTALRALLRCFSTAHPVGTLAEEYLVAHGLQPARIFRFPYLVDRELLNRIGVAALDNRDALRSEYGIGPQDFVVLGVMKFIEREDPLTLLRAFHDFATDASSAETRTSRKNHLVLVGDGSLRPRIEEIIRGEHAGPVHLPGYVNYRRLPEFFAMADILVHPARGESWGVTVNEALVCGLPVVTAHTVGSSRDLIRNGVDGLTFPAGDWKALSEILRVLSENREFLRRMAAHCAESPVLKPFTYAVVAEDLDKALVFAAHV